ncbi:MAG: GNAT family N-acetyltransferase [Clostridia bacterium]|nr:GNAT family N-acetyltransferase [Clostridia bacterium]
MIVRKIREHELKRCAQLSALAFEYPMEHPERAPEDFVREARERPRSFEDIHWNSRWAAFEDDDVTMMATFVVIPWRANFDGHVVTMGGIGGVASLPQYRRSGAIRRCFEAALPDMYDSGMTLSYLYPFSNAFYRKFGYELACDAVNWRLKLSGLPDFGVRGSWRMCEPGVDLTDDLRAIDAPMQRRYNGMVIRGDTEYLWAGEDPFVKRDYSYVYYDASGRPSAYATINARPGQELNTQRFAFNDREGLTGLLALFRRFAADHSHVNVMLPTDVDLQGLLPEYSLGMVERKILQKGMGRVVNVEEALRLARTRGEGRLRIAVTDGQIPGNNGTFEVEFARNGENGVRRVSEEPDIELTIQDLSRLLLGCCDLDPAWLPDVKLNCDLDRARQVFFRKPAYIVYRF